MSNYNVPKGEERLFHVCQELVQYDPKTGRKLSKPAVKKYGMKIFLTTLRDRLAQQGYTLEILHDPRTYEAAKAEEAKAIADAEMAAKEAADKAAKEAAEAKDAELAALKAELAAAKKKLAKAEKAAAKEGNKDAAPAEEKKED